MASTRLRPGQVAELTGVNVQTLRYYERRGLVPPPDRSHGGHRLYEPDTVERIKLIRVARRLGFTLDEVSDLITGKPRRHSRLNERAEAKLDEIDQRIADMQLVRRALRIVVEGQCESLTRCTCDQASLPLQELMELDSDRTLPSTRGRSLHQSHSGSVR
jgi:DNA-binding transcriptional MerR regulator